MDEVSKENQEPFSSKVLRLTGQISDEDSLITRLIRESFDKDSEGRATKRRDVSVSERKRECKRCKTSLAYYIPSTDSIHPKPA